MIELTASYIARTYASGGRRITRAPRQKKSPHHSYSRYVSDIAISFMM